MKTIYIILFILLSSTLYGQLKRDSTRTYWVDFTYSVVRHYPCNCNIRNFRYDIYKDKPIKRSIENFPYLGINMLLPSTNIALSEKYLPPYYNSFYKYYIYPSWWHYRGIEASYLNINDDPFLPKGEIEYYSIKSENAETVFVISDTSNQNYIKLSFNKDISQYYPQGEGRVLPEDEFLEMRSKQALKQKIFDSCLVQFPEYFLWGCYIMKYPQINNNKHSIERFDIYPSYKETDYRISRLVYQNDSIQQYLKTSVTSFPAWKAPYQPSKNIQRLSPIISKNIKKQLTKNISFEDIEAVNDDKVLITNTLDDLGRVKKQSYTYGEDFWKAEVTLLHNYGIDTDTMRQYICYPYKLRGLDTVLVMTAIYQNKKLISLHQNLLEQTNTENYYKFFFQRVEQKYPILPIQYLTYQVFYNQAGDVKQIIMPSSKLNFIYNDYSFYDPSLQSNDICILNFEYGDYDAKGNWQTVTVVGKKGDDQNEECGYKEVFSRKIKYKENP